RVRSLVRWLRGIGSVVWGRNERSRQRAGGEIENRHRPEIQNQLDGAQHGYLVVEGRVRRRPARVRRQRQQGWTGRIHNENRCLWPELALRYGLHDAPKYRI